MEREALLFFGPTCDLYFCWQRTLWQRGFISLEQAEPGMANALRRNQLGFHIFVG